MAKYVMLGKYTSESMKGISGERTNKATSIIKKYDGEVVGFYALLGRFDLLLVAEFPSNSEAMKASLSLSKLTGISLHTFPAMDVKEFDKLASAI